MKVQVMVTASGLVTLEVSEDIAAKLRDGQIVDLADVDPDWDEVLNQLEFEVDDAV